MGKSENLSLVSRTHIMKKENHSHKLTSGLVTYTVDSVPMYMHMYKHAHKYTHK